MKPEEGQASMELVVLLPVILAFALIFLNVGMYLYECSWFNQCFKNTLILVALSPDEQVLNPRLYERSLEEALNKQRPNDLITIQVECRDESTGSQDIGLSITPHLMKVKAAMHFKPVFSSFHVAFINWQLPLDVHYTVSCVIDPYIGGFSW